MRMVMGGALDLYNSYSQRGNFPADRCVAIWPHPKLVEILLEVLRSDIDHFRPIDVDVELAEVGLVRANRAVRQVANSLSILKKIDNRLLHVHRHTRVKNLSYWWLGGLPQCSSAPAIVKNYLSDRVML